MLVLSHDVGLYEEGSHANIQTIREQFVFIPHNNGDNVTIQKILTGLRIA